MMIKIKEKPPMPWYQKVFYTISFIFLFAAFIYLGTKNFNAPIRKLTDQESFTQEFGITSDNLYVYKTAKEVLELMNTGSGIVFFAFPDNEWSHAYADILNDVAKRYGIEEIWYYNFLNDRTNDNYYYNNIVRLLEAYLPVLDTGEIDLYAPSMIMIKDGVVTMYDDETAIVSGDVTVADYWTQDVRQKKMVELGVMMESYLGDVTDAEEN